MAADHGEIGQRCIVAGCLSESVGVLVYDGFGNHHEQPLCEPHSDPGFHLRDLDAPAWTWKPHEVSGSQEATDGR